MADYVRFPTDLWLDAAARKADPDLTLLRAFYMSHPAQTIDGISRCSDSYTTDYLRFSKQKIAALRRKLMAEGFIVFDEKTDEMYLRGFLEQNPPKSGTNAVSLKKNVERLRSDAVRTAVMQEVGAALDSRLREFEEQKARKRRQESIDLGRQPASSASNAGNYVSAALERTLKYKGWSE